MTKSNQEKQIKKDCHCDETKNVKGGSNSKSKKPSDCKSCK